MQDERGDQMTHESFQSMVCILFPCRLGYLEVYSVLCSNNSLGGQRACCMTIELTLPIAAYRMMLC